MIDMKKEIEIADFPEIWQKVVCIIGTDAAIELFEELGGNKLYIPKKENAELYVIKRLIREEHKAGHSINSIAQRYQLDPRTVRKYINQK